MKGKSGGCRPNSYRWSKKGVYAGIKYDSTWELAYIIYNIDHNIPIARNNVAFCYTNADKKSARYYPDFVVNGNIVEIKGLVDQNTSLKAAVMPVGYRLLSKEDLVEVFDYVEQKYATKIKHYMN